MNDYQAYFKTVSQNAGNKKYEHLFAFQVKTEGLPAPVPEFKFHAERRWRFDFAWPDQKIGLEIEGGIWANGRHNRGAGFEGDCIKYNEAALAGWRVIRVSPKMVTDLRAIKFIQRALNGNDS